jgi:hypothetical protein
VILFGDVVEVFDLTDPDARLVFCIVAFDRRRVGAALVDRDFRFCRKLCRLTRVA